MTIKAAPFLGRREDFDKNEILSKPEFITGRDIGSGQRALDTITKGVYLVNDMATIVINGGTISTVNITGHAIKKGDIVRIISSTNTIEEQEMTVKRVIDANNVELDGNLSASLTAGDEVDILRSVTPRYSASGASLATVEAAPVRFILNGLEQEVNEDTVVPANNAPLPVKLTGVTGDVNITAGDLNVNINHAGPGFSSTRIGDGVDLLAVNTDGSINTKPQSDVPHGTVDSENPIKVGGVYKATPVAVDDGDKTDLLTDEFGALRLSANAATSETEHDHDSTFTAGDKGNKMLAVRQDARGSNVSASGDYASLLQNANGELYTKDTDVQTAVNAGYRQADEASSAAHSATPVLAKRQDTLASDTSNDGDYANLKVNLAGELYTSLSTIPINANASTRRAEYAEDLAHTSSDIGLHMLAVRKDVRGSNVNADGDYASLLQNNEGEIYVKDTDVNTNVAAASTKLDTTNSLLTDIELHTEATKDRLPLTLGQKASAESLSVVLSSETTLGAPLDVIAHGRLNVATNNLNTSVWVQLIADIGAVSGKKIMFWSQTGEILEVGIGAAAAEESIATLPFGSKGEKIEVNIPANSRVSVRSITGNVTTGNLVYNIMG